MSTFNDHLDACARCRDEPFNLCRVGAGLLHREALGVGEADRLAALEKRAAAAEQALAAVTAERDEAKAALAHFQATLDTNPDDDLSDARAERDRAESRLRLALAELTQLKAEEQRLRERVAALEAEVAGLRADAARLARVCADHKIRLVGDALEAANRAWAALSPRPQPDEQEGRDA